MNKVEREPGSTPSADTPQEQSEVLISGVDIGPSDEERVNVTPTVDHARFVPLVRSHPAPGETTPALDNEDG
ncbi:hypothetical protein ACFP81_06025 [Deinococcus lacus]|uniref:Uncharacterized protein n=1 Tax=Deinococcus lacus TaxID=392561 RepID=A0ABW1YBR6_9DEIO